MTDALRWDLADRCGIGEDLLRTDDEGSAIRTVQSLPDGHGRSWPVMM